MTKENKKFRILVIEDDLVHRTVIDNILRDEGYEVITAEDGGVGVEKVFEEMPDLVITDIRMPVKDGYTVCRELRDNERTKYLPVVILTANHSPEDLVYGFEQGAFDYILKPFENQELMARVNAAIKFKELRDELIHERQKSMLFELAGAAAHELNQPLTVLKTTSYLLKEKYQKKQLNEDDFIKYIERMEFSISRMGKIIGKMDRLEEYKTRDYTMGTRIINLQESTDEELKTEKNKNIAKKKDK